jgi:hypothetical protein
MFLDCIGSKDSALMSNQVLANTTFFVLGIVCFIIATRAFYVYIFSKSDVLFVIGLSMADIGVSVIVGYLQDIHFIAWNAHLSWYIGTILGASFLVLGSWVNSYQKIARLKRWLIVLTVLYFVQTLLTPIMPQFSNPYQPAALNVIRTLIALTGSVRYFVLYFSKRTRFTLLMSVAFLLIGSGFGVLTPYLFNDTLANFLTLGYSLRIVGYSTLLAAYSLPKSVQTSKVPSVKSRYA